MTVREIFRGVRRIFISGADIPVERTVASACVAELSPGAGVEVAGLPQAPLAPGEMCCLVQPSGVPLSFHMYPNGSVSLIASHPSWLFALYCLVRDEWTDHPAEEFFTGRMITPAFPWLRNLSDFMVGSLRNARQVDRESYVRQIARQGFSHVTVNGLGTDRAFETGPKGDVYSRFYDYSPDLDQFVESSLIRGTYPADYLQVNLASMKELAGLAAKYGLTPGLHINAPRSMPEEFWRRYPFLRGARVDHPRESMLPRYTLALAHPAVQQHYRELIGKIMSEIPDIGFIHVWTNDSGAGFEFVSSLYAGRNGGPYIIREWKDDATIARAAAANVVRYYHLLFDEARSVNPAFRLVCDLGPFYAERPFIIPELGNGLDAGDFGYFEGPDRQGEARELERAGAWIHRKADVAETNVLGVPSPWLTHEKLRALKEAGTKAVLAGATPGTLSPFDVNNEIVRGFQFMEHEPADAAVLRLATRWAGSAKASLLVRLWQLADQAVRNFPAGVPCSTFGFPWFRLWVRPFVPNIDAIPEGDRAYYEQHMLATFNNPARIDLNNDMMWNFLTPEQASTLKQRIDDLVVKPLDEALELCPAGSETVFSDLRMRLLAARCFFLTLRNTMAWTEAVHGYLQASTENDRARCHVLSQNMVYAEIDNAQHLLDLWNSGERSFLPVALRGESMHIYGDNFGELLTKKIALMKAHVTDIPFVDPDYMWRMQ